MCIFLTDLKYKKILIFLVMFRLDCGEDVKRDLQRDWSRKSLFFLWSGRGKVGRGNGQSFER